MRSGSYFLTRRLARDLPDGAAPGAPGAPTALADAHGYGLAGIAERVASCGGSLTVGPVSPFGFAVTARLPVR